MSESFTYDTDELTITDGANEVTISIEATLEVTGRLDDDGNFDFILESVYWTNTTKALPVYLQDTVTAWFKSEVAKGYDGSSLIASFYDDSEDYLTYSIAYSDSAQHDMRGL